MCLLRVRPNGPLRWPSSPDASLIRVLAVREHASAPDCTSSTCVSMLASRSRSLTRDTPTSTIRLSAPLAARQPMEWSSGRRSRFSRRSLTCAVYLDRPAFLSSSAVQPEPSPKLSCGGSHDCCLVLSRRRSYRRFAVIPRPTEIGAFQFVVLASLRTLQLARGCSPRIDGLHRNTVIAQLEVSQRKVVQVAGPSCPASAAVVEV